MTQRSKPCRGCGIEFTPSNFRLSYCDSCRSETCSVEGCNKPSHARMLCGTHLFRLKNRGSVGDAKPLRAPICAIHYDRIRRGGDLHAKTRAKRGSGYIAPDGYKRVVTPDGRTLPEHRYVMEKIIGRPLRPEENVHHLDGRRSFNDPSNLELWSKSQPAGQRVEDKLQWAREIIALYGTPVCKPPVDSTWVSGLLSC